ncbi:MAG TPA: hypothetical protein VFI42_01730 [Thermomicrobiaceae bacterium]|nr:hypothetical protein [Thermomicrobiaceae bacterium]
MQPVRRQLQHRGHERAETRDLLRQVFDRYWDDVAPLNNYTPETARLLLVRESARDDRLLELENDFNDPWVAVRLGLRERAAGRVLSRA